MPEEIALCDRMHCNWQELEATPAQVVELYRLIMGAEAEGHNIRSRWDQK